MTDRKWKTWEVIGLLVTLALGNLLHFVYEWSGDSPLTAPIAAVNESTWEHMKLLAVPWVLFSLVERAARGRSGGTVPMARALGLLGRRQNDWRAVEELTDALRAFDAEDPARYDFSLFGAGMDGYLNEQ